MSAKIATMVDGLIQANKVMVFSKTYCPYCVKAKKLLTQLGAQFGLMELDVEEQGAAVQDYLQQKTGQRTVPNIFIGQKHVGGCDSIHAMHKKGELKRLLEQ